MRRDADGLFDRLQNRGHPVDGPTRADDEVDVINHEHVRPQVEIPFRPRRLDRLRQPEAGPFGREELVLAIATEGQFVSMPRLVIGPALAMPWIHGR